MINSLFMLGGCYNRDKKISTMFIVGWIIYMFVNYDFSLGLVFPIINAIVLLSVTISINIIKNRKINTYLSIFSIIIWSILIDTICYFFYPRFLTSGNIFTYIFQGILFNYKYIFTNIIAICCINVVIYMEELLKNYFENKNILRT